ncbi:MAG TPA: metallophosphoesterase family protein [Terriglobia bacterium]|nr:metallophosphoesterase family protein [Terriglobia bacterium]
MRYLIISDIHSNLEAYQQCLRVAQGRYEEALCLGDLVGYGPDPNLIVEAVRGLASVIIRGNHDKACAGLSDAKDFNSLARMATLWTREQLTPGNLAFLRDLAPGPARVNGVELVHGSPRDEDEYLVEAHDTPPAFEDSGAPLVFFGHTHLQGGFMLHPGRTVKTIQCGGEEEGCTLTLDLEEGVRYLINPGSIGQPRDRDWRAAFAVFDSERRRVEYYRTSYDFAATQDKMRKAGLPEPLIARLQFGR